ncbi:MAG: type II secretion system protein [Syntrophales bacterium]|nr:type II secretion system protein [Syntrophales bacterium]
MSAAMAWPEGVEPPILKGQSVLMDEAENMSGGEPGGFTLIELLIVISVLGILAGMMAFAWQQFVHNTNLKTAAAAVMSDITLYRQRAVAEGVAYCIQFTAGSPVYTIHTPSCGDAAESQRDLGEIGRGVVVSDTVAINFRARGTADRRTIELVNSRGSEAVIRTSITGIPHATHTRQ